MNVKIKLAVASCSTLPPSCQHSTEFVTKGARAIAMKLKGNRKETEGALEES